MSSIAGKTVRIKERSVTIRSARVEDAEQILKYLKQIISEGAYMRTTPEEFTLTVEQEAEWIRNHLDAPGKLIILAEAENQIVGYLDFSNFEKKRVAHNGTFGISVLKEWRNLGIGRLLLETMLDWARRNPLIEKIYLDVFASNERAIHLYKKLGFVEEGRKSRHLKLGDGQYEDEILMSRFVK